MVKSFLSISVSFLPSKTFLLDVDLLGWLDSSSSHIPPSLTTLFYLPNQLWFFFSNALICSLISNNSFNLAFSPSRRTLNVSSRSSWKSSSSLLCQGYSTNTWNPSAVVAMKKFVSEKRRAINMMPSFGSCMGWFKMSRVYIFPLGAPSSRKKMCLSTYRGMCPLLLLCYTKRSGEWWTWLGPSFNRPPKPRREVIAYFIAGESKWRREWGILDL